LLYCCWRCNLYKADYWPTQPGEPVLWNPRQDPAASHLLLLADATLYAITPTGQFTVAHLRLNRPTLVAYRHRQLVRAEEARLLERYQQTIAALDHVQRQHALLLEEHRSLLREQRTLLNLLLQREQ
jgi:hypothetical protein